MVEGGLVLSVGICGTRPRIFAAIAVGVTYVTGADADAVETRARHTAPTAVAHSVRDRRDTPVLVEGVIGIEP